MLNPNQLHGIQQAVDLLLMLINSNKRLLLSAILMQMGQPVRHFSVLALRMLGFTDVEYLVPNRFEQGYGLSVPVAEMAMEKGRTGY